MIKIKILSKVYWFIRILLLKSKYYYRKWYSAGILSQLEENYGK